MNSIAHEGKEKAVVQLDEFCGLEAGLKVDSERHVVAIVTSNETHCLAFRNEVEMRQWADVLRDHLGLGNSKDARMHCDECLSEFKFSYSILLFVPHENIRLEDAV